MINKNLFLAHTPYHILMASTIIKQDILSNNTIIIFEDFKFNKDEYKWLDKYFNKIILIKSEYKLNKIRTKLKNKVIKAIYTRYFTFMDIINIKNLTKDLSKTSWNRIHCFNDIYEKVQILIYYLKSNNTKVIYIEDGSAAYWIKKDIFKGNKIELKKFFSPKRIFLRYFNFLDKYEVINIFGEGSYIDSSYFLYPDLICDELKIREVKEIKSEKLNQVIMENNNKKFNINNSIIILAELYSPDFNSKYKNIIYTLNEHEIYIKYHPRESVFYLDDFIKRSYKILPNNTPLENILVNSKNNIIIGNGGSTVFLTLPKISNNQYISINKLLGISLGYHYERTLERIGVMIPENYKKFNKIINSIREGNLNK